MGEKLVFWRDTAGRVNCLHDFCPHRGAALSIGKVKGDHLQCPFHGFQYESTGQCCLVPSRGKEAPFPKQIKASGYPTYEANGFIYIWWGEQLTESAPPDFFQDLDGMSSRTIRVPWKAHYSRAIENQLDVAHLPFVHYNTIGRGGRTLVDGPLVEWFNEDRFRVFVFNRLDDGVTPRKSQELTRPDSPFYLEFVFPNLWQNHLSSSACIVLAFVPVDLENTMMYLRFCQRFVTLPLLRELVNILSMPFNLRILRQDQTVVETQLPKPSQLRMGEKLVQADLPIVEYRKRRQELIEGASAPGNRTR